jgi:transcriptional regulator with XRE-family HTH domain
VGVREKFAKRLKQLRKTYRLTQEELAEKADIAYKHIQRLESKHPNAAKIDTLEKFSKAFGISLSKLFNFRD